MPRGPTSIAVEVQNFALVTHAVPAERVLRHLPPPYELQTFFGDDGTEMCFVSATCFCNRDFRWALLPYPRHTFNESTYRTYVRHKGGQGVYFLGRYLGTRLAVSAQKTLARDTYLGDFTVATNLGSEGYDDYTCRVSSDRGHTSFKLRAKDAPRARGPLESGDEHAQFITYRLEGYFTSTLGAQGHMPVGHPRMSPYEGELLEGRFDLWDELGIVPAAEAMDAFSVLIEPGVPFELAPPRPLI